MRHLNFGTCYLLFERQVLKFAFAKTQVNVPGESSPEILYRRRKLGHKIAGFKASEDLPSRCLQP